MGNLCCCGRKPTGKALPERYLFDSLEAFETEEAAVPEFPDIADEITAENAPLTGGATRQSDKPASPEPPSPPHPVELTTTSGQVEEAPKAGKYGSVGSGGTRAGKYGSVGSGGVKAGKYGAVGSGGVTAGKYGSVGSGGTKAGKYGAVGSGGTKPGKYGAVGSGGVTSGGGTAKKLDPADYQAKGVIAGTVIKEPGMIDGQAFNIDSCRDSTIYVMDKCDQVMIDKCVNCTILIGPTDGPIFIRDCTNCRCAFLCRQLRTRDCRDCDIMLFCRTRPIIESSSNMRFGCYDLHYDGLPERLAALNMPYLQNFWSAIYDFTPKDPPNFSFMDHAETTAEMLGTLPDVACLKTPPSESQALLRTWGERKLGASEAQDFLFVVFPPGAASSAHAFALQASQTCKLLRANHAKVDDATASEMASGAGWEVSHLQGGHVAGLEFGGPGVGDVAEAALAAGACTTRSQDVAVMFRALGVEG